MPYIEESRRRALVKGSSPLTAGELNYAITITIIRYICKHERSYQIFNDVVGALDNAKDEFRRRILHPYEDGKIKSNGDVYP